MLSLDLDRLPEELRQRPVPLADEQNAVRDWEKAVASLRWRPDGGPDWTPAECRTVVESNASAIDFIDAGIRKGRARFSSRDWFATDCDGSTENFRKLMFLVVFRCESFLERDRFDLALIEIERLFGMGEAVLQGPNGYVDRLVGAVCIQAGLAQVLRMADSDTMPEACIRRVLQWIRQASNVREQLADALAVDFWELNVAEVERLAKLKSSQEFSEALFPLPATARNAEDSEAEREREREIQRCLERRELFEKILSGHPRPFDAEQTAYWMGAGTARVIRTLRAPYRKLQRWSLSARVWNLRDRIYARRFVRRFDVWPRDIYETYWTDMLGSSDENEQWIGAVGALSYPEDLGLGTHDDFSGARQRIQKLSNPIGHYICLIWDASRGFSYDKASLSFVSERRIVAAILGLKRYAARNGRLPHRLTEIVDDDLPRWMLEDPWTGQLLRYYPDQGLVMSADFEQGLPRMFDHPWRSPMAWQMQPFFDENASPAAECATN